jgi:acyl-CoA thioesterase II
MTTTEAGREVGRASVDDVLRSIELRPVGDNRWEGTTVPYGGWVAGGQLVGQAIAAATAAAPGKQVTSVHTVFTRMGGPGQPVTADVAPLHGGRSFASCVVTLSQGDRALASSLVLSGAPEDDLVTHAVSPPDVAGPEMAAAQTSQLTGWDHRHVGDVDLFDPMRIGPPELQMWSQFATGRRDPLAGQALLAWASVGSLIGTAMRPHEGLGLSVAHHDVSSGPLSHTLTFHSDVPASEWLLFALQSTAAGGGRAFGTGQVFTADGRLVASLQQEAMLRRLTRAGGL